MTRSRNSNTKVYKVRKNAVDMAVGFMIASSKYAASDIKVYKENAIKQFGLTNMEIVIASEFYINYLSQQSEQN